MKGALIVDKCSQSSYYVKNKIAYFLNSSKEFESKFHLGGKYAPPFMNFPYVFDEGYLLKIEDFGSVFNMPDLDLDVIILSLEKSDYLVEEIRNKYPNACIISSFKEYNPSGGHPTNRWNDRLIKLYKEVDIPSSPYFKLEKFKEFEKIINRKLVYLPDPIDVDYLSTNHFIQDRPNTALCYISPTHLDRGQKETLEFCSKINKKYGVQIITPTYSWPYDHNKRISFKEFIYYMANSSFCINLDKWYQIGQAALHCASLGTVHIGGIADSNLNLFKETAINDLDKLEHIFKDLYTNPQKRIEYIQTVFERVNANHNLTSVRNRIKTLINN